MPHRLTKDPAAHARCRVFLHVMFSCCQRLRERRRPQSRPDRQPEERQPGKRCVRGTGPRTWRHKSRSRRQSRRCRPGRPCLDDIGKGGAGGSQQGFDVSKGLLSLGLDASGSLPVAGRCPAGRTGTPCCRSGCRGNTADGCGCVIGRHDGLAHVFLLTIS